MLRFLTAGESHGATEVAILDGIPAGLSLSEKDIQPDLEKRQAGSGRGGRGSIETDQVEILSGVRNGLTIGSPISIIVKNLDYENWKDKDLPPVTNPRPGHADYAGSIKYGYKDIRNTIERASARETVMRVAGGSICRKLLSEFNIKIASHTVQIGQTRLQDRSYNFSLIEKVFQTDPDIRCIDKNVSERMLNEIIEATNSQDTLGGVIEIISTNVPPGLGSYIQYDKRLDARLAANLMSIPSVKAVEMGEGIINSTKKGSEVHDQFTRYNGEIGRSSNRAGGIEGGVSNGETIITRIYLKPISTLGSPLKSVDLSNGKETLALQERSDICVVPRAGIVAEAMTAITITDLFLEKFGSDSLSDIKYSFNHYIKRITS